ncbi:hypothetical protein BJ878DRAFT_490004, partial [Calycina marina]
RGFFFISTSKPLIDSKAINTAFASGLMYWVKPMEEAQLKKMHDNLFCFGLYELPNSTSASKRQALLPAFDNYFLQMNGR